MTLITRLAFLPFFLGSPAAFAVDFASEIQPIMREKCFKCHSGPRAKKGIRYDDAETLAGFIGEHEKAVIKPGKPEDSLLVQLASLPRDDSHAMPPPQRGEGLSIPELTLIKQWITEGASLEKGAATETETAPAMEPKLLTWTNTEGQSLQAYFVRSDGANVILKKETGEEFSYPMSKLSLDSRKLATDQSQAAP